MARNSERATPRIYLVKIGLLRSNSCSVFDALRAASSAPLSARFLGAVTGLLDGVGCGSGFSVGTLFDVSTICIHLRALRCPANANEMHQLYLAGLREAVTRAAPCLQ